MLFNDTGKISCVVNKEYEPKGDPCGTPKKWELVQQYGSGC